MPSNAQKTAEPAGTAPKGKRRKKMFEKSMFSDALEACPDTHYCQWPECTDIGEHRAPHSRQQLDKHRWFCLDHIRQYNRSWNYYDGMSDEEVETDVRRDTTWNRPSWPLGAEKNFRHNGEGINIDDFGAFGDSDDATAANEDTADQHFVNRPKSGSPEALALAVFDLQSPVTLAAIKDRYKALVKRHHPDANGGDKGAEEKFKQVSQAYQTLMAEITE